MFQVLTIQGFATCFEYSSKNQEFCMQVPNREKGGIFINRI